MQQMQSLLQEANSYRVLCIAAKLIAEGSSMLQLEFSNTASLEKEFGYCINMALLPGLLLILMSQSGFNNLLSV